MDARLCWCLAAIFVLGCDDKPSMADSLKQADEKEAKRKAQEEADNKAVEVKKESDKLELPWTPDAMQASLQMGLQLEYKVVGTDAKGKPVEDTYFAEVKGSSPSEVGVSQYLGAMKDEPIAGQVAKTPWDQFSPFFLVERAEHELVKQESVTVPAGTFDTVVVELQGFFGAHKTVWMIKDKPGIYAKVVDHGNTKEEDNQTAEMTFELTKIGARS
jgi:hypothetical protein